MSNVPQPRPPRNSPFRRGGRELAGQRILSQDIYPLTGGWSVPSESSTSGGRYLVFTNDEDRHIAAGEPPWSRQPSCTCPDNRIRHARCKHIAAVFAFLAEYEIARAKVEENYGPG